MDKTDTILPATDTTVSYRGHQLRRRTRGSEVLWQSADADPTWGYWYSTARQAAAESNASDRVAQAVRS